jgi:activator of HSP90 ATPase
MQLEITFGVPCHIMFEALTDAQAYMRFTQSPCTFDKAGDFSIFDGNILGTVVSIDEPNRIVMKWAFRDWGEARSDVEISITARASDECVVRGSQTNYPTRDTRGQPVDPNALKDGWENMIFKRIETFMGYPQLKD